LEERLVESEDKAVILDKIIELAEVEYVIPIRKNPTYQQRGSQSDRLSLWIDWHKLSKILSQFLEYLI
jgi:hypothetical protein